MFAFIKIFLAMLGFSACQPTDLYKQDLDCMYTHIKENHPGVYNAEDSAFVPHLEQAYTSARASLAQNSDPAEHKKALETFAQSFNDTHLQLGWYEEPTGRYVPTHDRHFEIKEIAPEVSWITLPTFNPNTTQKNEFDLLLNAIPNLRHTKTIVFDIRGNCGGNSEYGHQIITSLFGAEYTQQKVALATRKVAVDWRVSSDNLAYLQSLDEHFGNPELRTIVEGMTQCLADDKPYYREKTLYQAPTVTFKNPVAAKIIIIIDGSNGSAALDFIDELKMMGPPIILVGQKTAADRLYMECRTLKLPSGRGAFCFPIKVYRNRARGDNEPYMPDFEYNTKDSSKLEEFIKATFLYS